MPADLLLGPMLRRTEPTSAALWVETDDAATVTVRLADDGGTWEAPTFAVHGHHYALVELTDLAPGRRTRYEVLVDGAVRWPAPGSDLPPSTLTTPGDGAPVRLAFGSCRTSVPHDAVHHLSHGVDALRTYALALADGEAGPLGTAPDLLLLLGDQVYADATSTAMQEFIAARRDITEEPGEELADYEEYAHLYRLAWGEPALRWLFSWLPSLMIFDDHDVRDDWNTSAAWRAQMEATSWWHGRIVAALGSYWVYQHLGNLSVEERAADPLWRELRARREQQAGEVDLTDAVDAFAEQADRDPESYRWSYTQELGASRLVVVDSRAARTLEPGGRAMLDPAETAWLDEQLTGDVEHLLVATSLPFLLPMGLHRIEALSESVAEGRFGRRVAAAGERVRQEIDLEHWAAFGASFAAVTDMVSEVAEGRRGGAPASVLFLSGDVHFSYITEVERASGSRILQLVCSPIRNPLPRALRAFAALGSHAARPLGLLFRWARTAEPPWRWHGIAGPWFDNNLAVLELSDGRLRTTWLGGRVLGAPDHRPELEVVADLELDVPPAGEAHRRPLAHVHPDRQQGLVARLRRRTTRRR
ncbi:MAG TPA: alkaline phosphatase D family protein [Phototrophicaceae bacterium]|nr:alkaline phosphatase D family protein [Phototrophicaceae bacterium]